MTRVSHGLTLERTAMDSFKKAVSDPQVICLALVFGGFVLLVAELASL
jgi:hypothetical protein